MTLYAYKVRHFFLNGWLDAKTLLESYFEIDNGEEYLESIRSDIADRLTDASDLFEQMGWKDKDVTAPVWFAPLPAPDGPNVESEFLIAIQDGDEFVYVASPFELPWLLERALARVSNEATGRLN